MSVTVKQVDITQLKVADEIVSAANGIGVAGCGVAGAIARAAGGEYSKHIKKVAFANPDKPNGYSEGEVFVTESGNLIKNGVKAVLQAVTMHYPGQGCSYDIVEKCLYAIFNTEVSKGYRSVAVPGLGTGIGNLNSKLVAQATVKIAKKYQDQLDILIIDIDPVFVAAATEAL